MRPALTVFWLLVWIAGEAPNTLPHGFTAACLAWMRSPHLLSPAQVSCKTVKPW